MAYGNGLWVAVAVSGTNRVMTSPDGITWTARAAAEANGWASVAYGDGLWVAVANFGTNRVMTSGATFVQASTSSTVGLVRAVTAGGRCERDVHGHRR